MKGFPKGEDCVNFLGYLRCTEQTELLHWHRVKVYISTLPADPLLVALATFIPHIDKLFLTCVLILVLWVFSGSLLLFPYLVVSCVLRVPGYCLLRH